MIPSDQFVMFYNEIFRELARQGPKALDKYYERVACRQANFTLDLFRRKGLKGVDEYYQRIRREENCDMDIVYEGGGLRLTMNKCPSLTKALESDAGASPVYCDHCPGWSFRVYSRAGLWEAYDLVSQTVPKCESWIYTDRELCRKKYEELLAKRGPALARTNLDDYTPYLAGSIADSKRFEFFHPNVKTAFEFLRKTDLMTLKPGRNEVDGDRVYVNIATPTLVPYDKPGKSEAHRKYMDIQVPLNGKETFGTFTMTEKELALPFDEKGDAVLFNAQTEPLELVPGEFVMFFPPYGGHRPCCTQEKNPPKDYRKAIVKVLI